MNTSRSERGYVVGVLRMAESEGPIGTIPDNTTTKEPSCWTEVLVDVEAGRKGGLEVDEEGSVAADENAVVDVDG